MATPIQYQGSIAEGTTDADVNITYIVPRGRIAKITKIQVVNSNAAQAYEIYVYRAIADRTNTLLYHFSLAAGTSLQDTSQYIWAENTQILARCPTTATVEIMFSGIEYNVGENIDFSGGGGGINFYDSAGRILTTGTGAPANAQYLTLAADAGLTSERILTLTAADLTGVDSGAGAAYTLSLANTAVAPGTYGDADNIPQITVDAKGRATSISNIPVSKLDDPGSNGVVVRTALNTTTARTITGTANRISLTNGDGVAGNPTIDISGTYVGQASITTLGTIGTGTWEGTAVANAFIAATLSSKTIDNSNTIAAKDTTFTIEDDGDATKKIAFQASSITTGNTRTLTAQDKSYTLAGTDDLFYSYHFAFTSINMADATAYHFNRISFTPSGTDTTRQFKFLESGTLTDVVYDTFQTGNGSSELVTLYLRNVTTGTDYIIGTFAADFGVSTTNSFIFTGLSITINATNYWAMKVLTPTWTTNPTAIYGNMVAKVKRG